MRRLLGCVLVLLLAGSAEAGIVILKNGRVVVGTIEAEDVTPGSVKVRQGGGFSVHQQRDIRWFDPSSDVPTFAYFKKYLDEPLDPAWEKYREEYNEAQKLVIGPTTPIMDPLAPIRLSRNLGFCEVSIRKPLGWTFSDANGILMLTSEDKKTRIHLFASDLPGKDALDVAHAALDKLGARFESEEPTRSGLEWQTTMRVGTQSWRALRRIVQTEKFTAFAVAYGDEKDWDRQVRLVQLSLGTFQVK